MRAWPRQSLLRRLWRGTLPIAVVLGAAFALGYPIALLFGLPLAQAHLDDRDRWTQRTFEAAPPLEWHPPEARFAPAAGVEGVLVYAGAPVAAARLGPDGALLLDDAGARSLAAFDPLGGPLDGVNRAFRVEAAAPGAEARALYLDGVRLAPGFEAPPEKPDGGRVRFSFSAAQGPFVLRGRLLEPGDDYALEGATLVLREPPPLWLSLRAEPDWARPLRVTGDYAWADESTIVLAVPPPAGAALEIARTIARWAPRLSGPVDGTNRTFTLPHGGLVPDDAGRQVFVDDRPLRSSGRRPPERADGTRTDFTFPEAGGALVLDGRPLEAGRDYAWNGGRAVLAQPPPPRAQLLQFDYLVADAAAGTLWLAQPPSQGSLVWAARYTVYERPKCGADLLACFLALPQHPVPLSHWILARTPEFLARYDWNSDRNVLREVLYTARGTLVALLAGGAVGLLLAALFVLVRPLERALLPWVIASQTVPIIALVPMLVLVLSNFGIRIQTSILPTALIGGYLSFFPITVGAAKGLRSVDPLALDLMRSYAASRWQVFVKVRLYAAMPFVFASFKVGAAASLVGALISETETSNAKGLGFAILGQVQAGNVADLWILFFISALMGILFVSAVGWLERRLAPWGRRD